MLCVEQHIDPPTFIPLRRRSWGPSNIPPHVGGGTRDEPKERLHRRLSDIKPVSTIDTRIRQSCTRASRPRWATRSDQKTVCRMKKLGVQLIPPGWDSRCAYHLLRKHRKFWLKIQLAHVLSSRTFLNYSLLVDLMHFHCFPVHPCTFFFFDVIHLPFEQEKSFNIYT